jgi:hypothetical protein
MGHLLLRAQAWWDAQRFDQPMWQVAAWPDQKLRHIQLHVEKALGKVVVAYGEGAGATSGTDALARVRDEVLPDLAIYRSQLINLFPEVGAPSALAHRSAGVGTPAAEPLLQAVLGLSRASAQLAAYLEPREHGVTSPVSHIREAIADLQASAEVLATAFAIDMTRVHQARLEALLGAPSPRHSSTTGGKDGEREDCRRTPERCYPTRPQGLSLPRSLASSPARALLP